MRRIKLHPFLVAVIGLLLLVPAIKGFTWLLYWMLVPIGWISGEPPVPPQFDA